MGGDDKMVELRPFALKLVAAGHVGPSAQAVGEQQQTAGWGRRQGVGRQGRAAQVTAEEAVGPSGVEVARDDEVRRAATLHHAVGQ